MDAFNNNTVLVIDDEDDFRETITRRIKKLGCRVFDTSSGDQGLELLEKHKIDLMLTDIKMPGMDGLELLERIKTAFPSLLSIMMTAYGDKESVKNALKLGAYDFLEKPFKGEHLIGVVVRGIQEVRHKKILKEILEVLLYQYSSINPKEFDSLRSREKEKILQGVLGLIRIKYLNIKSTNNGR